MTATATAPAATYRPTSAAAIAAQQMHEPDRPMGDGFVFFGEITAYTITEEPGKFGATARVYLEVDVIGGQFPSKIDSFTWTPRWKRMIGPSLTECGLIPSTPEEAESFVPEEKVGLWVRGTRKPTAPVEGDRGYYEPNEPDATTHAKVDGRWVRVEKGTGTHKESFATLILEVYPDKDACYAAYDEWRAQLGDSGEAESVPAPAAPVACTIPGRAAAPSAAKAAPAARTAPAAHRNVPQPATAAETGALSETAERVLGALWARAGGTAEAAADITKLQEAIDKHPVLKQQGLTFQHDLIQGWITDKYLPF